MNRNSFSFSGTPAAKAHTQKGETPVKEFVCKGILTAAQLIPIILRKHPYIAFAFIAAGTTVELIEIWKKNSK